MDGFVGQGQARAVMTDAIEPQALRPHNGNTLGRAWTQCTRTGRPDVHYRVKKGNARGKRPAHFPCQNAKTNLRYKLCPREYVRVAPPPRNSRAAPCRDPAAHDASACHSGLPCQ
eukprot:364822-Chlamydomonas_euryale.AAC.12